MKETFDDIEVGDKLIIFNQLTGDTIIRMVVSKRNSKGKLIFHLNEANDPVPTVRVRPEDKSGISGSCMSSEYKDYKIYLTIGEYNKDWTLFTSLVRNTKFVIDLEINDKVYVLIKNIRKVVVGKVIKSEEQDLKKSVNIITGSYGRYCMSPTKDMYLRRPYWVFNSSLYGPVYIFCDIDSMFDSFRLIYRDSFKKDISGECIKELNMLENIEE